MSLKRSLVKPLINAVASAGAVRLLFGDVTVNALGMQMSAMTFGAGLGAASSIATDAAANYFIPAIEKDARIAHYEGIFVSIGGGAATFLALPKLIGGEASGSDLTKLAAAGAGVEVFSQWAYENLIMNGSI
jgi:hypothetical protein